MAEGKERPIGGPADRLPFDRTAPLDPIARLERTAPLDQAAPLDHTLAATTAPDRWRERTGGLPRGTTIHRYVVTGEVGAGGMGVVYAAYDYGLDRRVALKLLRDPRPGAAQRRLLREAQALAKLSHPNVVTVYDVGTHREHVFVAMELVEGITLREWLASRPRSWRDVVDAFLRAGDGLAAAHAAGIVHRDFKPDNVLIDRRGRVRVGDFGLALLDRDDDGPPEAAPAPGPGPVADATLTASGAVLGTPAYMAPEQHAAARAIDARADQFAFCVALYEALYGHRPFAGESALALYDEIASGRVREPPRGRAPAWLRGVIARGLACDPAHRYPAMKALLEELRRPRAVRRRRRWAAAVALAALGGGIAGAAGLGVFATRDPCQGAAAGLAGVWDAARRAELRGAFGASGARDAAPQWSAFARGLDRYTTAWAAMQTDSCEATSVRGEQSRELLELRARCLDRRMGEVRALLDLYRRADPPMVARATAAAADLDALDVCASAAALAEERPPGDPRAGRALRAELGRARAQHLAGVERAAASAAGRVVSAARAGGDRATEAAALVTEAAARRALGQVGPAEEAAYEAIAAAEAARSGETAADAWLELVRIVGDGGDGGDRRGEARRLAHLASAAIERIGGDPRREGELEEWYGGLAMDEGALDEARAHLERARALRERRDRAGLAADPSASDRLLAVLAHRQGSFGEALELYRRARAAAAELAPDHPSLVPLMTGEASCLFDMGRTGEALALFERARALGEAVLGPDHADLADAIEGIARAYIEAGHPERALEPLERAVAARERLDVPSRTAQRARAQSEFRLARLLIDLGRDRARALDLAREAEQELDRAGDKAMQALVRAWIGSARRTN